MENTNKFTDNVTEALNKLGDTVCGKIEQIVNFDYTSKPIKGVNPNVLLYIVRRIACTDNKDVFSDAEIASIFGETSRNKVLMMNSDEIVSKFRTYQNYLFNQCKAYQKGHEILFMNDKDFDKDSNKYLVTNAECIGYFDSNNSLENSSIYSIDIINCKGETSKLQLDKRDLCESVILLGKQVDIKEYLTKVLTETEEKEEDSLEFTKEDLV